MKSTMQIITLGLVGALATACGDSNDDTSEDSVGSTSAATSTEGPSTTQGPTTSADDSTGPDESSNTTSAPSGRRGADNPPSLGVQIDRAGRAAISTATIETFQADATIKGMAKDEYNSAPPSTWPGFAGAMAQSLAILDALDATCGNQLLADAGDTRYAFLAGVLADDRLWVNSASGECGVYLGVEAEAIGAVEAGAGGCGGRSPTDDVIETSYSVLAAGALSGVDDGVTADDGASPDTFPFLGAP